MTHHLTTVEFYDTVVLVPPRGSQRAASRADAAADQSSRPNVAARRGANTGTSARTEQPAGNRATTSAAAAGGQPN